MRIRPPVSSDYGKWVIMPGYSNGGDAQKNRLINFIEEILEQIVFRNNAHVATICK